MGSGSGDGHDPFSGLRRLLGFDELPAGGSMLVGSNSRFRYPPSPHLLTPSDCAAIWPQVSRCGGGHCRRTLNAPRVCRAMLEGIKDTDLARQLESLTELCEVWNPAPFPRNVTWLKRWKLHA